MREIDYRYSDPLDGIWLETARRIGLSVERSSEVFASTDGQTMVIGTPETLDEDDCLAQMIFHEFCHAMVQGPRDWSKPDWGLGNTDDRHRTREHACLRVQACLLSRYGLREVLAPTTDFRAFYDALGDDPLAGDSREAELAEAALARFEAPPFAPHLPDALQATADIAAVVCRVGVEANHLLGRFKA